MGQLAKMDSQLDGEKFDCDFWDVRIEDSKESSIDLVDGDPTTCAVSPSLGAFLRVRKNGFWLYESTTSISELKQSLTRLCKTDSPPGSKLKFQPVKQMPFERIQYDSARFSSVSLSDKLKLAQDYFAVLRTNKKVISSHIVYRDIYKVKSYINSVGNRFEFDFNQGGIRLSYSLKEAEQRFDDRVFFYGSKFDDLKYKENEIENSILESEKFLKAPVIEPGKYRVLLDPEVAGVFTHESFGHKSEADFMLGDDQALKDWKLGSKIGADILTIVDCGSHDNTSGYCPIDDDGTLAQKNYLIKNGILTGRLHSLDTSIRLDEKPTGNSRAMNFEFEPIVRMTTTYIEAGQESLESIVKRSVGAIWVEGVRHGSGLSTFTIAPTRGYRIRENGRREPVRVSVISGSVFETLKNIEAVSSDFHIHSSAIGGCGKMDQWPLPVADGGPFVLVKEMQVG
jgi:TldD protein